MAVETALEVRRETGTRDELVSRAKAARAASRRLATLASETKNRALLALADALEANTPAILAANERDVEGSRRGGRAEHMVERLVLNASRIQAIAADARMVAGLPDPVGEVIEERILPNGLRISRVRVPRFVIETRRTSASSSGDTTTSRVVVSARSRLMNSARSS